MLALGVRDPSVHHPHPPQPPQPTSSAVGRKAAGSDRSVLGTVGGTGQGVQEGFLAEVALSGDLKDQ